MLGSAYATIRGIPTAAFGAVAYFTVFSLAILAVFGYARMRGVLTVVVGLMFAASLYFLYLQAFVLHAFCPFCLFSAALTFFVAGFHYFWFVHPTTMLSGRNAPELSSHS